jgi:hypothetical protein
MVQCDPVDLGLGPCTAATREGDPVKRPRFISLACYCSQCNGRQMLVTRRLWRSLGQLPSPNRERAIHKLVAGCTDESLCEPQNRVSSRPIRCSRQPMPRNPCPSQSSVQAVPMRQPRQM